MRRPEGDRELVAGPDAGPESPYPIELSGPVIRGFGRGSKELGIPTANIPPSGLSAYPDLISGVYYGYVGLSVPETSLASTPTTTSSSTTTLPSTQQYNPSSSTTPSSTTSGDKDVTTHILPSVLSIGYNPFYANKTRSIEIHILQPFTQDFYGAPLNLLILGFIRPEYDYDSLESLVNDIKMDCEVAERSLGREGYKLGEEDGGWGSWLRGFGWVERDEKGRVVWEGMEEDERKEKERAEEKKE